MSDNLNNVELTEEEMEELKKKNFRRFLLFSGFTILTTGLCIYAGGRSKGYDKGYSEGVEEGKRTEFNKQLEMMGINPVGTKGRLFTANGTPDDIKNFIDATKVSNPKCDFSNIGVTLAAYYKK